MNRFGWSVCAIPVVALYALAQSPAPNARDLFLDPSADRSSGSSIGVLYRILLVDPQSGSSHPVDPERTFRSKDCFVIEIEVNTSGYLYVFSQGSSRQWVALFPEEDAASNLVKPGVTKRAPGKSCIEFIEPAGTERLFLVLLQDRGDSVQLLHALRGNPGVVPDDKAEQVALIRSKVAPRDLRIKKAARPQAPGERPFTTYAVARSPGLSVEIALRHE